MSESQVWSDAIAMALALRGDLEMEDTYLPILQSYSRMESDGRVTVDIKLLTAMVTLLGTLLDAAAADLGMDAEELGHFLLMEKFKRDLLDG